MATHSQNKTGETTYMVVGPHHWGTGTSILDAVEVYPELIDPRDHVMILAFPTEGLKGCSIDDSGRICVYGINEGDAARVNAGSEELYRGPWRESPIYREEHGKPGTYCDGTYCDVDDFGNLPVITPTTSTRINSRLWGLVTACEECLNGLKEDKADDDYDRAHPVEARADGRVPINSWTFEYA